MESAIASSSGLYCMMPNWQGIHTMHFGKTDLDLQYWINPGDLLCKRSRQEEVEIEKPIRSHDTSVMVYITKIIVNPNTYAINNVDGMMDEERVKRNTSEELFAASSQFQGSREGYYFGCGDRGVGYYMDDVYGTKKRRKTDRFAEVRGGDELLQLVEKEAGMSSRGQDIDAKGLKRLLQNLEKRFNVNVEQRVKYSGEPQKFMESEVELDEAVCALNVGCVLLWI